MRWPHPGDEVLLQFLHQEVRWLLLVGLVGLQVPPGLLGAGEDIQVRRGEEESCFRLISSWG